MTIAEKQVRQISFSRSAVDEKKRTVVCTLATANPVQRSYAPAEILLCGAENVNMERAQDGLSVLLGHDMSRIVGITTRVWTTGDAVKCEIRFGNTELANEAFQNVLDGVLRYLSVGYTIERATEGEDGTITASSWTPLEVSLVAVPADPKAVIGRKHSTSKMSNNLENEMTPQQEIRAMADELIKNHREKKNQISALALECETEADFRRRVIDEVLATPPIPYGSEPLEHRDAGTQTISSWGAPSNGLTHTGNQADTPGALLVRDANYRRIIKSPRGRFSNAIEWRGTLPQILQRATLTSSGLTAIQKVPGVVLVEQQPLRVADLFTNAQTQSSTIRFTSENSFTNAATAVAEEGQKPEASFDLTETDVSVKKIAVIGRVTDEMFQDYEYAQSYVNQRLMFMVAAIEDNHLLNGTGNTNQIKGVLSTEGIQTISFGDGPTIFDVIHKGITKIESTPGFYQRADAIVMHPTDWQNTVLTKDGNQQYYWSGPAGASYGVSMSLNREMIWGRPVVVTTAIAQGTALIGSFKMGGTIFRRTGITIESTNSDASDFQYNRIAIRAEERLALAVYRPAAFCKVTAIPNV